MATNHKRIVPKQPKGKKPKQPLADSFNRDQLKEYILNISYCIAACLEALAQTDYSEIKRDDLGLSIRSYFNYPHNVKVDLIRDERQPFYSGLAELPLFQGAKEDASLES